ncbi:STAS domain-containing protein [candidate division KSB1 bacterium]|nr:STAS domain-containing protein [candidate division KSB1 bacterium]
MEINEKFDQEVLILTLDGELMGGPDAEKFRRTIDHAIEEDRVQVVVDMDKVKWMNSSGLGMLISALTSLRSSNGDLKLANLSDRLRRPFEITKLDNVIQQFPSVSAAVNSFK